MKKFIFVMTFLLSNFSYVYGMENQSANVSDSCQVHHSLLITSNNMFFAIGCSESEAAANILHQCLEAKQNADATNAKGGTTNQRQNIASNTECYIKPRTELVTNDKHYVCTSDTYPYTDFSISLLDSEFRIRKRCIEYLNWRKCLFYSVECRRIKPINGG